MHPWAWAIIHGGKRVENRTWGIHYRGPLLIHAGKSRLSYDHQDPEDWLNRYGLELPPANRLAWGAIIGKVDLVACVQLGDPPPPSLAALTSDQAEWLKTHPFTEGPYCWVLRRPQAFPEPVPCRGLQGLFHVPASVVQLPPLETAASAGAGKQGWLFD
jgi:hypothetical protein